MTDQGQLIDDGRKSGVYYGDDVLETPFAQVPVALMRRGDLQPGPRLLYAVLATFRYHRGDPVWPSKATLAEHCGVSERQVRTWQAVLIKEGYVTVEDRPGRTPMIWLWPNGEGGSTRPGGRKPTSGVGRKPTSGEEESVEEVQGRFSAAGKPATIPMDGAAQLQHLREGVPPEDLSLIDEWLDAAASQNQSGTMTMSRRVNETRALLSLRGAVGAEAWRYGMSAALRKEGGPALALNYVKKAAGSWRPGMDLPGNGRRLPVEDPARQYERELMAEDAERERLAEEERRAAKA